MAIRETTRILNRFVAGEREALRTQYGPEAVAIAHDMTRVLQERLETESAYASLWDAFKANPDDNVAKLTGALEAMVEADPALGRRLNAFIEEFHEAVAPPGAATADLQPEDVTATDVVPDTTLTSGEKYGGDAGAYLRGNLKSGAGALSEKAGTSETTLGQGTSVFADPASLATLPQYFDDLHDAIDEYPKRGAADKERLHQAVREIETTLRKDPSPDIGELRQYTAVVEALAPEISGDLQRRLDQLIEGQQP
jgi:hypothetical protein